MEDHFDISYELEAMLEQRGKTELLAVARYVAQLGQHCLCPAEAGDGAGACCVDGEGPGG